MKKHLLAFVFLLLPAAALLAQVSYSFSTATATFSYLSSGTTPTLVTPFVGYGTADEGYANGVPIGFDFVYNGISYTAVNINVNGFMTLGSGFVVDEDEEYYVNNLFGGPTPQTNNRPVIAPLWDDLDLVSNSNLKYAVSGTAPNRVFTVEWARARWTFAATSASISFQAKLYETTNVVEFNYRRELGNVTDASASIGITSVLAGSGNFLSLSSGGSSPTVSSTVETTDIAGRPVTNQVYRFTPLACIAPSATNLSNITSSSLTFSWNAIAGATGYEYATSTSATPPASGTATTSTSVSITGLNATVINYFYVRSTCGGGTFSEWSRRALVVCTNNTLPANGAVTTKSPTLQWNAVTGATGYTVMFSLNGTDYINLGSVDAPATTANLTNLSYNTTYYFYIRPIVGPDTASLACQGNATSFMVGSAPVIPCAKNLLPQNGATGISPANTIISWNKILNASSYAVMLSSDGGTTYTNIGSTTDTTVNLGGAGLVDYNTTYNFYIRPVIDGDTATTGCVSNATSFRTSAVPPVPANDNCAGAIVLTPTPVNATTLGASESIPAESCAGFMGNANDDVWFKFTALSNGSATIALTNAADGLDAVLQGYSGTCGALVSLGCADNTLDAKDESLTLNNLVAGQTYYLRVYGFYDYVDGGTFNIQINGTALPITLASFTGQQQAGKNILTWLTQSEQNSKGFELQRSADGTNFSTLNYTATKATNGLSSTPIQYQHTDAKPFGSSNYYRLKQLDKDGAFSYSGIVLLKGLRNGTLQINAIYPNPVGSALNLVINAPAADQINLMITDVSGRTVMQRMVKTIIGDNLVQLPVSSLAKGNYLLKAICQDGCQTTVQKFVKE